MTTKTIGNGWYTVPEKWLSPDIPKQEVMQYLCNVANDYVLAIDNTFAWGLAELHGITRDDFYDAVKPGTCDWDAGIYRWTIKTK